MKQLLYIFLVLNSVFVNAQNASDFFEKGNKLYTEQKYTAAIEAYETVAEKGMQSSELYFNLGNCYYKLNKIAPSIYNYEKALKIDPNNEDALNNLSYAKRMSIDVIEELPKTFLQRFSENVIMKLTYDQWAITGVVAAGLAALLFLLYYFSSSTRKKFIFFNMSLFMAFMLMVSTVFAFSNFDTVKKNRQAIIFAAKSEVKNAPMMLSELVFELHEGTKVLILDGLDNWVKIRLADGKIGWIPNTDLKEI
jgi:tetratricopeptide (TPR) repeat protein